MDICKIKNVLNWLRIESIRPNMPPIPITHTKLASIKDESLAIAEDVKNDYPILSNHIKQSANSLFSTTINNGIMVLTLNHFAAGVLFNSFELLIAEKQQCIWNYVHPLIIKSSKNLYVDGHYTNAAEDAFIEVNSRLKKIYKALKPEETYIPDGVDLMHKIFPGNPPLLPLRNDNTDTAKNIQDGFHFMFAGAMSALRNPKAHSNEETISAEESLRRLMFASSLMFAVDEAVRNKGISETFEL